MENKRIREEAVREFVEYLAEHCGLIFAGDVIVEAIAKDELRGHLEKFINEEMEGVCYA